MVGQNLFIQLKQMLGGKIVQVGSRLIDMTAKKMADIFFGKFSELVSNKTNILKTETVSDVRVPREKKSINKILIYSVFNNNYSYYYIFYKLNRA